MRILISISVDEILLPRYMNWSTNFRGYFVLLSSEVPLLHTLVLSV